MLSFSDVTFVLLLFVFVVFAFPEAAAFRPIVLCSSICMRPDSHTLLVTLQLSASFIVFVSSLFCFFGDQMSLFGVFLYHYRFLFV